jgi:hypothetical protein
MGHINTLQDFILMTIWTGTLEKRYSDEQRLLKKICRGGLASTRNEKNAANNLHSGVN